MISERFGVMFAGVIPLGAGVLAGAGVGAGAGAAGAVVVVAGALDARPIPDGTID